MADEWGAALEALTARLDGLVIPAAGPGFAAETLRVSEFPPDTTQTNHPYGYIIPSGDTAEFAPSKLVLSVDQDFRIVLAGRDATVDALTRRYYQCRSAIRQRMYGYMKLGGVVDKFDSIQTSGLSAPPEDKGSWGFTVTFAGLRITEQKEFAP